MLLLLILLLFPQFHCDVLKWTWYGGSYYIDPSLSAGNYIGYNISDSEAYPAIRRGPIFWKFGDDMFLFGGFQQVTTSQSEFQFHIYHNDLWKFSNSTWIWLSGSDATEERGTSAGIGITDSLNVIGARYGSSIWVDENKNNMFLFGGLGWSITYKGYLNDIWQWNQTHGWVNWKFPVTADAHGNYGTQGITHPDNYPGGRQTSSFWQKDNSLYIFGGDGYDSNSIDPDQLADLWLWDVDTHLFTWIGGPSVSGQTLSYGVKGIPSANNWPGYRLSAASWKLDGLFYLFGGRGLEYTFFSDLWVFDPNTKLWTYINGPSTLNEIGEYCFKNDCAYKRSPYIYPASRNRAHFWAGNNELWLFGGSVWTTNCSTCSPDAEESNDLWSYSPSLKQWAWRGGSNFHSRPATYNLLGGLNNTIFPGARSYSAYWVFPNNSSSFELFFYGGFGIANNLTWSSTGRNSGFLYELWKLFFLKDDVPDDSFHLSIYGRNMIIITSSFFLLLSIFLYKKVVLLYWYRYKYDKSYLVIAFIGFLNFCSDIIFISYLLITRSFSITLYLSLVVFFLSIAITYRIMTRWIVSIKNCREKEHTEEVESYLKDNKNLFNRVIVLAVIIDPTLLYILKSNVNTQYQFPLNEREISIARHCIAHDCYSLFPQTALLTFFCYSFNPLFDWSFLIWIAIIIKLCNLTVSIVRESMYIYLGDEIRAIPGYKLKNRIIIASQSEFESTIDSDSVLEDGEEEEQNSSVEISAM